MAADNRMSARPLNERLYTEPWRFDFWQAVRILRSLTKGEVCTDSPEDEAIRFTARVSQAFPASELYSAKIEEDKGALQVNFIGLAGAHGPLPAPVTDLIMERIRVGDTGLRDFLDLFNNRLISLYYNAIVKLHPGRGADPHPSESPFAQYAYAIAGMGTEGLRTSPVSEAPGGAGVPDASLLRHAALFATHPRSAVGLEMLVADHFEIPAKVIPFRGGWLTIEPEDRTRIGPFGQNQTLGDDAVLGNKAWDQSSGFTLVLGPLTADQYKNFLPCPAGNCRTLLLELVRFYVGEGMECSVELLLKDGEHIDMRLGFGGDGWLGWV
ncbi:type VI secretion system baseplate subunit TssG [Desulfovibrio sp. UCD-KL4C]|uniref:type VI secretion system baseplate subunit TssG n=1 Tax=Desulfovibrio sp. UCD-KL4C TaxID=2578120 RepID=UPI0025BE4E48|nr:type VI secretion system baseplate subunit TssG [Desulfovibrio sp. UCD-KL4C]